MNEQELPLADIHLPGEVAMWPPAPGWWIVLGLVLLMAVVLFFAVRRYKAKRLQRDLALKNLAKIDLKNDSAWQQINETLKRAALAYCDREEVASLSGKKWKAFLLAQLKDKATTFEDQWLYGSYSGKVEQDSVYRFHRFAETWLKSALPLKRSRS